MDEIVTDGARWDLFGVKHPTAADAPHILVAAHGHEVAVLRQRIKADFPRVNNRRLESDCTLPSFLT